MKNDFSTTGSINFADEATEQEIKYAPNPNLTIDIAATIIKKKINPDQAPMIIDNGSLSIASWPGVVSKKLIVNSGQTTDEIIDNAVSRLNEFYVPVNPKAKTRCIDGRHDPQLKEDELGPQVPGGAPGAALSYVLGVDKDDLTRGNFLSDAETMINNFIRLGFNPGGHRDRHSQGKKDKAGCGAIDHIDEIVKIITNPAFAGDHKRIAKQILGSMFSRDDFRIIQGSALQIQSQSDSYFRDREKILDILEAKAPNSTSILDGDHNECLFIVNLVPGTTFSSNRFSEEFNGLQAFGYDLWSSMEMASRIMPRTDQVLDRNRYIAARILSTIATLTALTDGSQKFILRMP